MLSFDDGADDDDEDGPADGVAAAAEDDSSAIFASFVPGKKWGGGVCLHAGVSEADLPMETLELSLLSKLREDLLPINDEKV